MIGEVTAKKLAKIIIQRAESVNRANELTSLENFSKVGNKQLLHNFQVVMNDFKLINSPHDNPIRVDYETTSKLREYLNYYYSAIVSKSQSLDLVNDLKTSLNEYYPDLLENENSVPYDMMQKLNQLEDILTPIK